MTQNQLAFPELDQLIDWLNKNPNYSNSMIKDIASKSSKWNLSPKQIQALEDAWNQIKNFNGKSPFDVNIEKFPELDKLIDFMSKKTDWEKSDDIVSSILYQVKNKIISDKQLNVLINKWKALNSNVLPIESEQVKKLSFALKGLDNLMRAPNSVVAEIPLNIRAMFDKMLHGTYNEEDDKRLMNIVHKYRRKIFSSLFD